MVLLPAWWPFLIHVWVVFLSCYTVSSSVSVLLIRFLVFRLFFLSQGLRKRPAKTHLMLYVPIYSGHRQQNSWSLFVAFLLPSSLSVLPAPCPPQKEMREVFRFRDGDELGINALFIHWCISYYCNNLISFWEYTVRLDCFNDISFHTLWRDTKAHFPPQVTRKNIPVKQKCCWAKNKCQVKKWRQREGRCFWSCSDRSTAAATCRACLIGQHDASRGAVKVTSVQRASIRGAVPFVLLLLRPCLWDT